MMRTVVFFRFRAGYAIAACGVALAAFCAWQAPGMMRAFLVVGANAQLPLERLAAEAGKPMPVFAAAVSSGWKEREPATTQKLEEFERPVHGRHGNRDVHGYEHAVTDYKYWT